MASVPVLPRESLSSPTAYSDDDWLFQTESELILDERGSADTSRDHEHIAEDAPPLSTHDVPPLSTFTGT